MEAKTAVASSAESSSETSYKFQRLREKIRQAVLSGEWSGKLPGERELARRFEVNAKTLSKALTDLAAEGLLIRSIGRGTYVKSAEQTAHTEGGAWLIIADETCDRSLIAQLSVLNPRAQVLGSLVGLRPSFLNQFESVVLLSSTIPETKLRDLLVRGMRVVCVGRRSSAYSTHAVLLDRELGAAHLSRNLIAAGHRRIAAVEIDAQHGMCDGIRRTAARLGAEAVVEPCTPEMVCQVVTTGATALICESATLAAQVRRTLAAQGISVPGQVSLAALGCCDELHPCTGYYVQVARKADAVAELLRLDANRPITLWLTGTLVDRGTIVPLTEAPAPLPIRPIGPQPPCVAVGS